MADLLLFIFVGLMALWGMKSGFIKTVFHLGYYIISMVLAMYLYPILSGYLLDSAFGVFIHNKVIMPRLAVDADVIALPGFLKQAVASGIESTTEAIAASVTKMTLNIISFFVVFIAVKFGLRIVVNGLNLVAKLPVLSFFNKIGGLAAGAVNGLIISYVVLALIAVFANNKFHDIITMTKCLSYMYNNNIILKIIFG